MKKRKVTYFGYECPCGNKWVTLWADKTWPEDQCPRCREHAVEPTEVSDKFWTLQGLRQGKTNDKFN